MVHRRWLARFRTPSQRRARRPARSLGLERLEPRRLLDAGPANLAPSLELPGPWTVAEDQQLALAGWAVRDDGPGPVELTIQAGFGRLQLRTDVPGGLTPDAVLANGGARVVARAAIERLNATLAAPGGLTYRPAADWNGVDVLTVQAADQGDGQGGGPAVSREQAVITVLPVNDPPRARGQQLEVWEDRPVPITLWADDGDPEADQPLQLVLERLPADGWLALSPHGPPLTPDQLPFVLPGDRVVFTADHPEPNGEPLAFSYHVVEPDAAPPAASQSATVSITVLPVNDPPVAEDVRVAGLEDSPVLIGLQGDDGDPEDQQQLTYVIASTPERGVLLEVSNGSPEDAITADSLPRFVDWGELLYVPEANDASVQTFQYYVVDDGGVANGGRDVSDLAVVTIGLAPVNDPPELAGPSALRTTQDEPAAVAGVTVFDVDAGGAQVELTVLAARGQLEWSADTAAGVDANPVEGPGGAGLRILGSVEQINAALAEPYGLTYRPAPGYRGGDVVTIRANDLGASGSGGARTAALTIPVTVLDGAPWRNWRNPADVNGDGVVSPIDLLLLINRVNSHGTGTLPPPSLSAPPPYWDPSGDGAISPIDLLIVINTLNQQLAAGEAGGGPARRAPEIAGNARRESGSAFAPQGLADASLAPDRLDASTAADGEAPLARRRLASPQTPLLADPWPRAQNAPADWEALDAALADEDQSNDSDPWDWLADDATGDDWGWPAWPLGGERDGPA